MIIALFLGLLSAHAAIEDLSLRANSHLLYREENSALDSDNYRKQGFLHEADMGLEMGEYRGGILFSNRVTLNRNTDNSDYFQLEKKRVGFEDSHWQIFLGDTYQELGRGIALSLNRNPAFGFDNTLEGASVNYTSDWINSSLFGGRVNALTNPVNVNPLRTSIDNRELWLVGAQTAVPVTSETKLGGHYLFGTSRPKPLPQDFSLQTHTAGLTWDTSGPFDGSTFYLESNVLNTRYLDTENRYTGYGSYAAFGWTPGAIKTKFEVKDYRNYQFEFSRPPTLEEDFVENANVNDVTAMRLGADWNLPEIGTVLKMTHLIGYDRIEDAQIQHPVMAATHRLLDGWEVELKGGYRSLMERSKISHARVKSKIRMGKAQYIEAAISKQDTRSDLLNEDRNRFELSYQFYQGFVVGTGLEYMPKNDEEIGKLFLNGNVSYQMEPIVARAFVGKTSGGTLCSGGICRQVPPFTGGYVDLSYQF